MRTTLEDNTGTLLDTERTDLIDGFVCANGVTEFMTESCSQQELNLGSRVGRLI